MIEKPNGDLRFITNFQGLNSQLERNPFPIERIEDTLDDIWSFFLTMVLDLVKGYYVILVHPDLQGLLGLHLPWGMYCDGWLPQGLVTNIDNF